MMLGLKRANFRALIEGQKVGAIVHADGLLLFANQAFADVLGGGKPDKIVADTPAYGWVALEDKERLQLRYKKIDRGKEYSARYDFRVRRSDGTEAWVEGFDHEVQWEGAPAIYTVVVEITSRKKFEDNLLVQESQFRSIAESTRQPCLIYRDEKALYANQALADLLGYGIPDEILTQPSMSALLPPSEREKLKGHGDTSLRGTPPPPPYETQVLRQDGSTYTVECAVATIDWEGGPAVQVFFTDIAGRLKARATAEDELARFRDIAEVASDWFWETDETLKFTEFHGGAHKNSTVSTSNLIGRGLIDVRMSDDTRSDAWTAFESKVTDHRPFDDFEFPLAGTDGSVRQIRASGRPVFDANKTFKGYRGIFADVTDLVTSKQEAGRAKRYLEEAIEAMPDACVVYDAEDRLVACNSKFRAGPFNGLGELIAPGANFADLMNAALKRDLLDVAPDERESYLRECIAHHRDGSGAFEIASTDGQRALARERRMANGGGVGVHSDITGLKQTEGQLRAEKIRFKHFGEISGGWYWETDKAFHFTYLSDDTPGPGSRIGRTWFDLKLPDDNAEAWTKLRADLEAAHSFTDFRYLAKDGLGRIRHISVSGRPVFDSDGDLVGFQGAGRDVTEEREAETALQQLRQELEQRVEQRTRDQADRIRALEQNIANMLTSERQYRTMVDHAAQGMVVAVGDKPVYANTAFLELLGFADLDAFLATRSLAAIRDSNHAPAQGTSGVDSFSAKTRNDQVLWLEARNVPIEWEGLAATLITYVDVTEHRRSQAALVDRERELSMHLAKTPLAATAWTMDMICTGWNAAAESLFGFSSDEIIGRCPIDLIVAEPARDQTAKTFLSAVDQSSGCRHVIENLSKDGRRLVCEWSITPLIDDYGTPLGFASLVRDVTDTVQETAGLRAQVDGLRAEVEAAGHAKHELAACLAELKRDLQAPMDALANYARRIEQMSDGTQVSAPSQSTEQASTNPYAAPREPARLTSV